MKKKTYSHPLLNAYSERIHACSLLLSHFLLCYALQYPKREKDAIKHKWFSHTTNVAKRIPTDMLTTQLYLHSSSLRFSSQVILYRVNWTNKMIKQITKKNQKVPRKQFCSQTEASIDIHQQRKPSFLQQSLTGYINHSCGQVPFYQQKLNKKN